MRPADAIRPGGDGSRLRICLDARFQDGIQGGVQQTLIGLAAGFAALDDGPEDYFFLVEGEVPDWLAPYLGGRLQALVAPRVEPSGASSWKTRLRGALRRPPVDRAWDWARSWLPITVPESDGTIERAGIDVMHLTRQAGFLTSIPTVYSPYDLQHVHLPELFTRADRAHRAAHYGPLCARASAVVAISEWGKADLIRSLGLPPEKVHAIPLAPSVDAYPRPSAEELRQAPARLGLPEAFAYYPAQTWRHKNHLALLDALALLRDRDGIVVPSVFSGHQNEFFPSIERRVHRLGLQSQVRFLGFVTPADVQALYRLARMLVFPSLFEGFGLPLIEAFRLGVPVASSNATCLPEVAGGAAELDPRSVPGIADAIRRLWTDPELRAASRSKGRARAAQFSWRQTAAHHRAIYRQVAAARGLAP